jgi:hypothetical protein
MSVVELTMIGVIFTAIVLAVWMLAGIKLDVVRQRDEERRAGR